MMAVTEPTLEVELEMLAAGVPCVIGCDEVGRGALAGPVAVGLVVMNATARPLPAGIRDSKLLSEPRREALAPLATEWALYSTVGLASPQEVDTLGIIACLGLAGKRAIDQLQAAGADIGGAVVLLDGNHDYLNAALGARPKRSTPLSVVTRVKADRDCGSVAAASVIAKVHRDRLMILAHADEPHYGWAANKGYGSADHMVAIAERGPSELHRKSWLKMSA
jgi:ribonuclease HII